MSGLRWRPIAIALLGLVTLLGVPLARGLTGDRVPEIWLQGPAAAVAVFLLWQELRAGGRWRFVAILGGLMVAGWLAGLLLLWLIWPR